MATTQIATSDPNGGSELTKIERIGMKLLTFFKVLTRTFGDLDWTMLLNRDQRRKEWLDNSRPEKQLELF